MPSAGRRFLSTSDASRNVIFEVPLINEIVVICSLFLTKPPMASRNNSFTINSNQTHSWGDQFLRYIKMAIESKVNSGLNYFISHFQKIYLLQEF